jgi:hypothetical protein
MKEEMERLIGRAVTNKDFRDKLMADPEQAAKDAGFNLSADEVDSLRKSINKITANSTTEQIDQQLSDTAVFYWD